MNIIILFYDYKCPQVRQIKRGKCAFHYVEIMACPSGAFELITYLKSSPTSAVSLHVLRTQAATAMHVRDFSLCLFDIGVCILCVQ
jgi:hypothetical protein